MRSSKISNNESNVRSGVPEQVVPSYSSKAVTVHEPISVGSSSSASHAKNNMGSAKKVVYNSFKIPFVLLIKVTKNIKIGLILFQSFLHHLTHN